jgi:Flp pilus assembly protein TadD
MVRNHTTDAYFMSWRLVDVPAAQDQGMQLVPPLFPDRSDAWFVARPANVAPTVRIGPEEILPAARPVFEENRPVELFLYGPGLSATSRIEARVVNEVGRTVAEPTVGIQATIEEDNGFRRLELSPIDLPAGEYSLIMTLAHELGEEILRRALQIEVVPEHDQGTWVTRADGSGATEDRQVVADDGNQERMRKRELRERYRAVLSRVAAGDAHGAQQELARLERQALASPSAKVLRELANAERREVRKLAKLRPSSVAPIALLHRRLERSYVARNDGTLANHARQMVVETAEELARRQPENEFSGALMANVAVDLAQVGASSSARAMLEKTLRLVPGNVPALLSLGFAHERAAEHREAAAVYEKLETIAPEHAEARLRLAINLGRSGREVGAEHRLRDLMNQGVPRWIESLATQELVRLLLDGERTREAEAVLREAMRRLEDEQRLWILLAAVLDDLGRADEATEVLRALPPATRAVSPRARYAEWPDLGKDASPQALADRAEALLPVLEKTLEEISS